MENVKNAPKPNACHAYLITITALAVSNNMFLIMDFADHVLILFLSACIVTLFTIAIIVTFTMVLNF